MFSLRDLRFVLCSREVDVLRAQRIIGFSYLYYPQIKEVGKPDHMDWLTKFILMPISGLHC